MNNAIEIAVVLQRKKIKKYKNVFIVPPNTFVPILVLFNKNMCNTELML